MLFSFRDCVATHQGQSLSKSVVDEGVAAAPTGVVAAPRGAAAAPTGDVAAAPTGDVAAAPESAECENAADAVLGGNTVGAERVWLFLFCFVKCSFTE